MTYSFRPASSFTDRHGLFVAVAGGTSSGKTFSSLRLARGIAGPAGKIAVLDTEGGRTLHLKDKFKFDALILDPPHRPERYAEAAKAAEDAGYDVLVIDSFSMEWVGLGGVLDWQGEEFQRMGSREAVKLASWIKPKMAHKAMVYSFLQRRMPIVFSMRAEDKAKKDGSAVKSEWAPICNKAFPFEVTVSFMLSQDKQGIINLELPHKLEGDHKPIFKHGEQLSEKHGAALAKWACGTTASPSSPPMMAEPDGAPETPPQGAPSPAPAAKETVGQVVERLMGEVAKCRDNADLASFQERNADTLARLAEKVPGKYDAIQAAVVDRSMAVSQEAA